MADEQTERAQHARLIRELDEANYALYSLQPTASIAFAVSPTAARVKVYRVKPRDHEVLQDALQQLRGIEQSSAGELALPVEGRRAPLENWWHRRRLKSLSQRVDRLLQLVSGEQAVLITYHDMPVLTVQAVKVKLAAVALIGAGET